jgi:hypothetical protein
MTCQLQKWGEEGKARLNKAARGELTKTIVPASGSIGSRLAGGHSVPLGTACHTRL